MMFLQQFYLVTLVLAVVLAPATSANETFSPPWELDAENSSLNFQSIKDKNGIIVEMNKFASFNGTVDPTGVATISIPLDSIDTNVDLRNVRMRFLFFETFKFPNATVTVQVDPAWIAELKQKKRIQLPVEFQLNLRDVTQTLKADTLLTMFADGHIAIASEYPVSISVDQFGLNDGLQKLEEAASVEIVPLGAVSFNFVFKQTGSTLASEKEIQTVAPPTAAVETTGEFSYEECVGRFEILSRTGAIYFRTSSSQLDPDSLPLLNTVFDVISRCPSLKILVAGHTDSTGDEGVNMALSVARADSVLNYFIDRGANSTHIRSAGYGESRPVATNSTNAGRSRNRRIEFSVIE